MYLKLIDEGRTLRVTKPHSAGLLSAKLESDLYHAKGHKQDLSTETLTVEPSKLRCRGYYTRFEDAFHIRRLDDNALSQEDISRVHLTMSKSLCLLGLVVDAKSEAALLSAKANSSDGNTPPVRARMDSIGLYAPGHKDQHCRPM